VAEATAQSRPPFEGEVLSVAPPSSLYAEGLGTRSPVGSESSLTPVLDECWRYEKVVYTSSPLPVSNQGSSTVRDYAESGSEQVSINCDEEIAPLIESDTVKVL